MSGPPGRPSARATSSSTRASEAFVPRLGSSNGSNPGSKSASVPSQSPPSAEPMVRARKSRSTGSTSVYTPRFSPLTSTVANAVRDAASPKARNIPIAAESWIDDASCCVLASVTRRHPRGPRRSGAAGNSMFSEGRSRLNDPTKPRLRTRTPSHRSPSMTNAASWSR